MSNDQIIGFFTRKYSKQGEWKGNATDPSTKREMGSRANQLRKDEKRLSRNLIKTRSTFRRNLAKDLIPLVIHYEQTGRKIRGKDAFSVLWPREVKKANRILKRNKTPLIIRYEKAIPEEIRKGFRKPFPLDNEYYQIYFCQIHPDGTESLIEGEQPGKSGPTGPPLSKEEAEADKLYAKGVDTLNDAIARGEIITVREIKELRAEMDKFIDREKNNFARNCRYVKERLENSETGFTVQNSYEKSAPYGLPKPVEMTRRPQPGHAASLAVHTVMACMDPDIRREQIPELEENPNTPEVMKKLVKHATTMLNMTPAGGKALFALDSKHKPQTKDEAIETLRELGYESAERRDAEEWQLSEVDVQKAVQKAREVIESFTLPMGQDTGEGIA